MNQRIKLLAEQAGYTPLEPRAFADDLQDIFLQKFAELIVKECANLCKVVGADKVSNGSEDYNAGREMGAEVCHNMIKKHFGVE